MDRTIKILVAAGVLLTGTSAAMLFRRPAPDHAQPVSPSGEPLILRERIEPRAGTIGLGSLTARSESRSSGLPSVAAQLPAILRPMEPGQPPPELAHAYPGASRASESRGTMPAGFAELPAQDGWQTHKIVDGDTLTGLAKRYLGNGSRYMEIFKANRDLLSTPELLPIGGELKIPPAEPRAADSSVPRDERLVPVVPQGEVRSSDKEPP